MSNLIERLEAALSDHNLKTKRQLAEIVNEYNLKKIEQALNAMEKMGKVRFWGTDKVGLI